MSGLAELHVPVMLAEVVALLAPALEASPTDLEGGCVLVDCTLGLGGHAHALLAACPQAQLIGLDRDPQALALARERLAEFADRITLVEAVYDELPAVLARLGRPKVQGSCLTWAFPRFRLMIVNVGSPTLRMRRSTCGWDARSDRRSGAQYLFASRAVPNSADLWRRAIRGPDCSPDRRRAGREPFVTSGRLVQLLYDAVPAASRKTSGHPAKRTFGSPELRSTQSSNPSNPCCQMHAARASWTDCRTGLPLAGGQAGESKILGLAAQDRAPRDLPVVPANLRAELRLLTRGATRPSPDEIARNPRAASARLRAAVRISEMAVAG